MNEKIDTTMTVYDQMCDFLDDFNEREHPGMPKEATPEECNWTPDSSSRGTLPIRRMPDLPLK